VQYDEILKFLKEYSGEEISIMEVCGTHTAEIAKSGMRGMLSGKIKLVSGPGCPVCVTVSSYIDRLCELSQTDGHEVVTFGDMMRVPGSCGSLLDSQARGGRVKMVYSPFDTLKAARENPDMIYVFAAVGFETTAPIYALMIEEALRSGIGNIRLLTSVKTMPAAIEWICSKNRGVAGMIAPGHVSAVIGSEAFEPLAQKYSLPFAVAGFEATQIMAAIYALIKLKGQGKVLNLYPSVVQTEGNSKAKEQLARYFEPGTAYWRGMGAIPGSGLYLREEFMQFDVGSRGLADDADTGCMCGEVLTGSNPQDCPLFGNACTPDSPRGACMVSMEGACYSWYSYERNNKH
jgi:hydrogenase expression/formation protein HypD